MSQVQKNEYHMFSLVVYSPSHGFDQTSCRRKVPGSSPSEQGIQGHGNLKQLITSTAERTVEENGTVLLKVPEGAGMRTSGYCSF